MRKLLLFLILMLLLIVPVSADYALQIQTLTNSPADSVPNYIGNRPGAPSGTVNVSLIRIPASGILDIAEIYDYSGTAGTAEDYSYYVRVNNANDYLIATVASASNERIFSNTSMGITVSAGDYFEIKRVHPAWVTNPLTNIVGGYVVIKTQGANPGYALYGQSLTNTPADSVSNYWGVKPSADTTALGYSKIYIPTNGTITDAFVNSYSGTAGSGEAWSHSIIVNDATSYPISTVGVSANFREWSNQTMETPVTKDGYFQFSRLNPAFNPNPATNIVGSTAFVDTGFTDERIKSGYPIWVEALTYAPADGQVVYFGNRPIAPTTVTETNKVYIQQSGVIKRAEIFTWAGTVGTAEGWTLNIRVNNATNYLIATTSLASNERKWRNASMDIPVVAGDYFEIQSVQPTWATNPNTVIFGGYVFLEYDDPYPVVDFSTNVTGGMPPLSVQFTDESETDITAWNWSWVRTQDANTTYFSTEQNPISSLEEGDYHIYLEVTNASGTRKSTKHYPMDVTPSSNLTGWNRQDILMDGIYTLTLNFRDSATNAAIPVVQVQDSLGDNTTTTNGTMIASYNYTALVIYATSEGYNSKSITYIMDRDRTENVFLTPAVPVIPPVNTTSNTNVVYQPKQISIVVVSYDPAGVVVPDATVELTAVGNTLQDDVQLQTLYGINPEAANQLMNGTLIMDGETDSSGNIVFTILQSINYQAVVEDPATGTHYTAMLYPGLDPYTIWIGVNPIKNATEPSASYLNNTRLYITQPDAGNVTNNLAYQDRSGKTTRVDFIVKYANNLTIAYQSNATGFGTSPVYLNYTHRNIRGQGYFFGYNATRVL